MYGYAQVYEDAKVYGDACVHSTAQVFGNAQVCDTARVCGTALVFGHTCIRGYTEVDGASASCDTNSVTDLKVGDTVTLNSGGLKMTIVSRVGALYTCVWFSNTELMKESFEYACIKKSTK